MKWQEYETKPITDKNRSIHNVDIVRNEAKQCTKQDDMKQREYKMNPNNDTVETR